MKIAIFGASGATGKNIVSQTLEQNISVKALVRPMSSLETTHANLEVITGDAANPENVNNTIEGVDAVLVALGSFKNPSICSQAMALIIPAMQKHGVKRLVVESSYGTKETHKGFRIKLLWLFLGKIMADKERMEDMIELSNLEWVVVRPVSLTNGPRTGKYGLNHFSESNRISRADVAEFMIKQIIDSSNLGKKVTIYGK